MDISSFPTSSYQNMAPAKLFSSAVRSVFDNWQAFKIGTSMGKDSRNMVNMVIGATEQCFHDNRDMDSGAELGEWIGEMLDINFDLRIEDGSLDDAGNQLIIYWKMYQNEEYDKLREILENLISVYQPNIIPKVEGFESSSDDDDGEAEEEKMDLDPATERESTSSLQSDQGTSTDTTSKVDADGWTTVTTGKKKK